MGSPDPQRSALIRFRFSAFGCLLSVFGVWVSIFAFRLSAFGFRNSVFGFSIRFSIFAFGFLALKVSDSGFWGFKVYRFWVLGFCS